MTGDSRTLIASAADAGFMPLLRGLVLSLEPWLRLHRTDLGCLDLGLPEDDQRWLSTRGACLVEPGWDLPVEARLRSARPELRASTAKVFLPHYFPGYQLYLWIDADAWVQEGSAIDSLMDAATGGHMAVVPHADRSYRHPPDVLGWRRQRLDAYFGRGAARVAPSEYLNSGVFALQSDAPHWEQWARAFRSGLEATHGALCCDQTALNHAVGTTSLPITPLPAVCNWLCHLAAPRFDAGRQRFCEPLPPGRSIGILHLAGPSKERVDLRFSVAR